VTALVAYLGSLLGLWLIVLPAVSAVENRGERLLMLVRSLKLYNPLQIGVLGLLVITGAFQITELKSEYRELFAKELGITLSWKLAASFLLILIGTYQSMGLAHRFVRRYESGESPSDDEFRSLCRRLRTSTLVILPFALAASWLGLRLGGL